MTDLDSRTDVHLASAHPGPAAVREQPPAAPQRPQDDPTAGPVLLGLAPTAIAARRSATVPPGAPGRVSPPRRPATTARCLPGNVSFTR